MFLPLALCALHLMKSSPTGDAFDAGVNPILAKHPTANATSIVFEFAGDLWQVPRHGGEARRLTSSVAGTASAPYFSPDGTEIAFTAQYDGNIDAYVMPAEGGSPTRLTSHPGRDQAVGWTPDGKSVVVASEMATNTDYPRLFTVSLDGGFPKPLPFPAGVQGSFSPDGTKLAYVPNPKWEDAWKRYRGGQTTPIWIGDLSDSNVKEVPRANTNDANPMWIGDSIYYLSDPTGPVGLNKFDTTTGKETVVIPGNGFDIKSATFGGGVIAYEKLGSVHLFDPKSSHDENVPITLHGDFPQSRTAWKDLRSRVTSVSISPSGKRLVVCARGWAFTVPAKKGDTRLINEEQGVDRENGVWSPDGKTIAYTQDDRTGQHIVLWDTESNTERRVVPGEAPGTYANLAWSPDSKRIAYTDNKLNLWCLDVAFGTSKLIDTGFLRSATNLKANWSPDSKWLTYAHDLPNYFNVIKLYSFATGQSTVITKPFADASSPVFDRGGKYLYFLASTDEGFGIDAEDIMSIGLANYTTQVYAVLLKNDTPNPLTPESDEEKPAPDPTKAPIEAKKPTADPAKPAAEPAKPGFDIDLPDITQRILALPVPKGLYRSLTAGSESTVFMVSGAPRVTVVEPPQPGPLLKFSLSEKQMTPVMDEVTSAEVTPDGSKLLVNQGGEWKVLGSDAPGVLAARIDLSGLKAKIDVQKEWEAIYHQVWRKERILFYDPGLHGIDADVMEKRYEPFLPQLRSRADLNYLFTDMLGELCIGHMFIQGGDRENAPRVRGGLLGADFSFDNGRYRIERVYDGESWNPHLYAPLGNAGVRAKKGEYLLAINGKDLTQSNDIYLALEGKAGQRVTVKLEPTPDGKGAREVAVTPIDSDLDLRNATWQEDNRRYVEQQTNGRCGYVFVPDTNTGGWAAFMQYYYAQYDKDAIIIDERFNHGGAINDFMVREMEKPLDFYGATRYGQMFKTPNAAVYGPKIMLINEMAGSGGDIFPYIFQQHKTGKLVGHKTWGGELTSAGFAVIDGGFVRAPEDAQFNINTGEYVIDNVGVTPDIAVEFEPKAWRNGIDSQLKVAVDEIKKEMLAHPPVKFKRPKYPDKSKIGKG